MASSSNRKSGSSARSTKRKRVVIGADETVRVRYAKGQPKVDTERKRKQQRTPKSPATAGQKLSHAKRQQREVRVARGRRRRWIIAALLVAVVVLAVWGVRAALTSPLLEVQGVVVEGNSHLPSSEIASRAAIPVGSTLLDLPVSAIEKRVLAEPWVAAVAVKRRFPHTVIITVTERKPALLAETGGKRLWIVSDDGHWLGARRSSEPSGGLLIVRDAPGLKPSVGVAVNSPELSNAVKLVQGLSPVLLASVSSITAPSVENTALLTRTNVEVFIGSASNIAMKDRLARTILAQQKGKVVYVNVRSVDRPTWRGLNTTP